MDYIKLLLALVKRSSTITFTLIAFAITQLAVGQTVKTLKPTIGEPHNYSKSDQLMWQSVIDKYSKIASGDLNYQELSDKDKALIDRLENGDGPFTEGPGCSWYCGGQLYNISSNTYLKEQGNISYKPDNVHDFDLLTAWVPDTVGGVIGKKINFHFKPLSPRVNEIMIYNGYIKNQELFRNNSRVKKLKLYINNVYYATLEMSDTTAQQTFTIDPIQSKDKKKDLILTFEIVEIYKGDKYIDVAISEINFNGLDVH